MAKEEKKSIIADALTDYKQIQEAAEINARKKLAESFPDKFQDLLKEELNNKSNSEKEPYKKVVNEESTVLDESEDKKNSTMKKSAKEETKKVINEERDTDFTGDVETDTPNLGKGETEKGDTFTDKPTTKTESNANKTTLKEEEAVTEEFDVTDLDIDSAGGAIDGASGEDEIITMDQIEEEISQLDQLQEEDAKKNDKSDPFDEMVSMRDKLNEMIASMDEQKNHGGKQNYKGRENGGPTTQMIDEEGVEKPINPIDMAEQKNHGGKQNYKGRENGGPTTQMIDEEGVVEPLKEEEIDEALGMAHSSSKHVAGDHLPKENDHAHRRYGSVNNTNESLDKKFNSLIEQNKKLTKKINESKEYKETVGKLLENYKTAVEKYRSQLKEMAVFNSNLAHVNNLLVNESLALTQDDKITIINDFKGVGSINESKEMYTKILTEMKEGKKTLTEGVEKKLTESVGASSKGKMDEVVEQTAYENDEHINKMKKLMEYIERSDKKII